MMIRTLLLAICGLSLFSVEASARHILWTLRDVQFNDGGTAMGSFVYDADSNEFSAVHIITTAGSKLPGATYITAGPRSTFLFGEFLTKLGEDQTGLTALFLFQTRARTNAGGDVPLADDEAIETTCGNATCSGFKTPQRLVTSGFLEGTPVEEHHSTSSMGGGLPSTENTLAAALLGGLWIQAQFPLPQRPVPAPIPSREPLEAYLRPARCRVVGI